MNKIKARLLMLVLALGLVLLGTQATWAYTFTYDSGGFSSQSEVLSVSNGGTPSSDGPYAAWDSDFINTGATASVGEEGVSPIVSANSNGSGGWYPNSSNSIMVMMNGHAGGSSETAGGSGSAYGGAVTQNQAGNTTGIFFRITGGVDGEQVRINYNWNASSWMGAGGTVTIGGGSDLMYISLNGNRVWDMAEQVVYDSQNFSKSGTFMAQVNDLIGINLAANASIDFSGAGDDFFSSATNSMQLEAVPLPPSAWLLGSGLLGLLALRGFRPRRR